MVSSPDIPKDGFGGVVAESSRSGTSPRPPHAPEPNEPRDLSSPPRSTLIEIIEGEIIPRLFLAHREAGVAPTVAAPHGAASEPPVTSEYLAGLLLDGAQAEIVGRLQALLNSGTDREKIYRDLLASAPRTLNQFWEKGFCTLDGMTGGLECLDKVLSELHQSERTTDTE